VLEEFTTKSDPAALSNALISRPYSYARVGLEACGFSEWLYEGLAARGLPLICIEARHAHGVLKNRINKTDRNDARGIAEIMHFGLYKAVHVKSAASRDLRALLAARRLLSSKIRDIENGIAGMLAACGFVIARARGKKHYDAQVRKLAEDNPHMGAWMGPMMRVRDALRAEFEILDKTVKDIAGQDPICRRLMTAPGVGPLVALTYRTTVDIPERFARSRNVAAHLGLTPRTRQSGKTDWRGRISRCGDKHLRCALFVAATSVLRSNTRASPLRAWGLNVAERQGRKKAKIAVARRLAVILHRMWIEGTDYRNGVTTAFVDVPAITEKAAAPLWT
jgi:transposase